MPSFNVVSSPLDKHKKLLELLPISAQLVVAALTVEELFYVHEMLEYEGSNVSRLVLRSKALAYLSGDKASKLHPAFIVAVAKTYRWQEKFYVFLAS